MTDEFIDILNDDLTVLKSCLKSEAHKHGYLHASIHVWFYTDNREILLQKRSTTKIAFPDLWDVSVAGHISTGEVAIDSALREVEEEIGLSILKSDIHKIGSFRETHQHKLDFIDNEIHFVYIGKLSTPINQLKILREELSDLKLMPITQFKEALKYSDFPTKYVLHSKEYYNFILEKISAEINP